MEAGYRGNLTARTQSGITISPTNQLKDWSEEMYRILGFPLNTPMNLEKIICVFPPKELERFRKAVDAAINADVPYNIDYKIIRPDGAVRYIHDKGEVIRDEQGKAIWMLRQRRHTEHRGGSILKKKKAGKRKTKSLFQINKRTYLSKRRKKTEQNKINYRKQRLVFQNRRRKTGSRIIIANKTYLSKRRERKTGNRINHC